MLLVFHFAASFTSSYFIKFSYPISFPSHANKTFAACVFYLLYMSLLLSLLASCRCHFEKIKFNIIMLFSVIFSTFLFSIFISFYFYFLYFFCTLFALQGTFLCRYDEEESTQLSTRSILNKIYIKKKI